MRLPRNVPARWLFSGLFAAVAGWSLVAIAASAVRSRADGWPTVAFLAGFGLLFATPFALAAWFCFKRRYRDLFMVGAALAAFFLLGLCFTLPDRLGLHQLVPLRWKQDEGWRIFARLALSLVLFAGPFYISGKFLVACCGFAARRIPNGQGPSDI